MPSAEYEYDFFKLAFFWFLRTPNLAVASELLLMRHSTARLPYSLLFNSGAADAADEIRKNVSRKSIENVSQNRFRKRRIKVISVCRGNEERTCEKRTVLIDPNPKTRSIRRKMAKDGDDDRGPDRFSFEEGVGKRRIVHSPVTAIVPSMEISRQLIGTEWPRLVGGADLWPHSLPHSIVPTSRKFQYAKRLSPASTRTCRCR